MFCFGQESCIHHTYIMFSIKVCANRMVQSYRTTFFEAKKIAKQWCLVHCLKVNIPEGRDRQEQK